MVILTVLLMPLLSLGLLITAQLGLTIVTKARLQVTVDHAAMAAATQLAQEMNNLAHDNWRIHDVFAARQKDFTQSQKESEADGKQHLADSQRAIDGLREQMDANISHGYEAACQAALDLVQQELPWAQMIPLSGHAQIVGASPHARCFAPDALFSFDGDQVEPTQWPTLNFSYVTGGDTFFDPADVKTGGGPLLQYRAKPAGPDQQVAFAIRLRAPHLANWLSDFWPDAANDPALIPTASAAAQPVGGDLKASVFLDSSPDADNAAWNATLKANDLAYQPTLIPLARVQDRAAGYAGLAWEDDTGEWNNDDAIYLH